MKRCIRCNYRARTLNRLEDDTGQRSVRQYMCREEFKKECDKKLRERNRRIMSGSYRKASSEELQDRAAE